ncbi:roadblock/LC7 domain-containing protein [Streptomyces sp. NPDC059373]
MTVDINSESQTFNWLLASFVRKTDGVRDAVAVSSDGLLVAMSDGLGRTDADHLAAVVSGLARSASRRYEFDGVKLIMIEMGRGFLLVSAIRDGSCLALDYFEERDAAFVLAVNCSDGARHFELEEVREALGLDDSVLMVACDARDRTSVRDVLAVLMDQVVRRHAAARSRVRVR